MQTLSIDHISDLVRVNTYQSHADANALREFLLQWGITGVLVVDKVDQVKDGGAFEIMVPAIEAPRAISLMETEFNR